MGIVRKTKSVEALLDLFNSSDKALSVVDVVSQMQKVMNKTTVYRALERLEDDRFLHSFLGKDGLKWYSKCKDCCEDHHQDVHPHFQCTKCEEVKCLETKIPIPKVKNHKIESVKYLLVGLCEKCTA